MKNKLKRILYVGYYLYKMDRSVFWKFLNFTSIETGRSKLYLIVASINDSILFNVSLLEYFQFRFFEKNQLEKSNWAGTGFMYEYQLAMNPKNVRSILKDKILFLDTYKDFVRHNHLTLNELKKDEQKGAFLLQENTKVVLKNSKGQCGIGIVILNTSELTPYVLIQRLENTGNDIVEAFIQQHEDLEQLSPSGLNTLRLITQLNHENKVELLGARIRVTVNNSIDNMAAGNLAAEVDLKSGKICGHAVYSDITKEDQDTHPYTKTVFKGYQIPFFYEAITMVKEAALCFPQNRSIGWDVAITSTGPQLLEANHDWCRLVWQLPVKKGLKPILENHLKKIKTNKHEYFN